MESIGTKTKKLPTTEQNYDLLLGKDLSVAKKFIHLNKTAARKNKYGKFHVCAMEMKHRNHGGHCRT